MASLLTPTRLLESPSDVRVEIERRLVDDGLEAQCTDEEKLFYLWRLYQTAENSLQTATENEEKLKRAQTEEMQEVENYVEHIRHLSDEREALIQELETENDQLKQDIDRMRLEDSASALRDETAEMLTQQGLEEIAQAPTSEQIAFLLVERARLLDELEAEQGRSMSAADGRISEDLQRTLDKERGELEEEMEQERDTHRSEMDTLKHEHEEEINVVMDENSRLEDELAASKDKVKSLETRLKEFEDELKKEKTTHEKDREGFVSPDPRASPRQRPPSPARSPSDVALRQIIAEKTKIEGEIIGYKSQIRNVDNENTNLRERLSKMEKESEQVQLMNSQLQVKNKSLKSELDEMEQQLDDSEAQIDDLKKERDSLKDTLDNLSSEFSTLQTMTQKSSQLEETVERLNRENKDLSSQIESMKHAMDEVVAEKDELATQNLEMSKGEIELTNEIQNLKSELNQVKNVKDDFNEQKSQLERTQTLLDSQTFELEKLNTDTDLLNKENKELLNRLESVQQELESTKMNTQGAAKQELIMTHMRDQNSKLSKEVEDLKSQLKQKQEEQEEVIAKHKKEIEDMKAKLQLVLTELTKAKSVVEQERSENSELTARVIELESILEENSRAEDSKASNLSEMEVKVKELEKLVSEKLTIEDELEEQRLRTLQLQGDLEELEAAKIELEDSRDLLDQEKHSRTNMEIQLQELEQLLDDQKMEHESIQQNMTAKVKALENRVEALQDDLFAAQDELQAAQERYDKELEQSRQAVQASKAELLEAKATRVELQEKLGREEQKTLQIQQAKQEETSLVAQRLENQKNENYEKQIESMKSRLQEAQKQAENLTKEKDSLNREIRLLRESTKQFGYESEDRETMKKELEAVKRELEHLRTAAQYEGEERQQHIDKIRSMEEFTRQVELDNRELANKLSETLVKYEQAEEAFEREKRGTMDRQHHSNRQLHQVESDLDTANKKISDLRDEVQKKQSQLMKLETDKVGHSAKSESTIARMEAELNELKIYHRKEVDKLTGKCDQATKESKELRNQLRDKDQEVLSKQHEVKRVKGQCERLEAQLQTEVKIRTDLENRNTALDQEISKVWGQVRQLMEKNASLETSKRNLEDELERRQTSVRQAETTYAQSKASHETTAKALLARAEASEKRADSLQRELQEVSVKLQTVQSQVYQAENCKVDLQDKRDRVTSLKNQLDGEKLQRSLLDQTVQELQQQVAMLRQREEKALEKNRELQHTILDLESKLEEIHERSQTAFEMDSKTWVNKITSVGQQQHMSEVGKRSMMEQILRLQKDIKDLQYELLTANERRETFDRRYEERKVRTKTKLLKAREYYSKEKVRVQDQLNKMDEDLRLTRATLRKELDWKERMDSNYKHLLKEKRDLLAQLNENEEVLREKSRMVSILQVRTKFLEEENSRLQDRIDSITQQKHGLDKLLKEHKLGKEREPESQRPVSPNDNAPTLTVATSGLGNSVNSSWDHDHLMDAIMNYRTQSTDQDMNGYLGRSFTGGSMGGGSIDLYRGETGSESSFGQEFET